MRKFFRGLFILATLSVGMGVVFTSCKDTDDDYQYEVKKGMLGLNESVATLKNQLSELKNAQEACKQACEAKQAELNVKILALEAALATKADKTTVQALRDDLTTTAQELSQLTTNFNALSTKVDQMEITLNNCATKEALNDSVEALRQIINTLGTQLEANAAQAKADLENYQHTADSVMGSLQDQIDALTAHIENCNCDSLKNAFLTFESKVETFMTSSQSSIVRLSNSVDSIQLVLSDYDTTKQNAADALAKANKNEATLTTLQQTVDSLSTRFAERDKVYSDSLKVLDSKIEGALSEITTIKSRLDGLDADVLALYDVTDSLSTITLDLGNRLSAAETTIAEHTQALEDLNTRVDDLLKYINGRLDSMITGLIIDGVYNPVFGSLSTPFGVNSKVVMAYYGQTIRGDVDFPIASPTFEYRAYENLWEFPFTSADMKILKPERENYGGVIVQGMNSEGEVHGNAGTIYFRVNPGTVDMNGKTFTLVDTRDTESGVKLENIKKSDAQLRFGYSFGRSAENNGFYSAQATLAPEDVWSTKIYVDDEFKNNIWEVVKDMKNFNIVRSDLLSLLKSTYDQFNGILPANALKGEWTYPDENNLLKSATVYSPSELAATCFKPCSYQFLNGTSLGSLRLLNPLTEFDIFNPDDFSIDIKLDPIHLDEAGITITLENIKLDDLGEVTVSGKVVDKDGKEVGTLADVKVNTKDFAKTIQDAINTSIDGWNETIANQLNSEIDRIQGQIQTEVNKLIDSISGQINDQLGDLVEKINNKFKDKTGSYFDRINDFIKRYNKLAKQINRVLTNFNFYVQPVMVYKGSDGGFHMLSGNKNTPSKFKLNGGNAIYLYATSRTAEIISPAFKKFVGVTNVWKTSDSSVSAQKGDATAKALADKANANKSGNMDKVFDGQEMHVVLEVPSNAKGYTYEVVYQGLDYHGITSTIKCYVSVE